MRRFPTLRLCHGDARFRCPQPVRQLPARRGNDVEMVPRVPLTGCCLVTRLSGPGIKDPHVVPGTRARSCTACHHQPQGRSGADAACTQLTCINCTSTYFFFTCNSYIFTHYRAFVGLLFAVAFFDSGISAVLSSPSGTRSHEAQRLVSVDFRPCSPGEAGFKDENPDICIGDSLC